MEMPVLIYEFLTFMKGRKPWRTNPDTWKLPLGRGEIPDTHIKNFAMSLGKLAQYFRRIGFSPDLADDRRVLFER